MGWQSEEQRNMGANKIDILLGKVHKFEHQIKWLSFKFQLLGRELQQRRQCDDQRQLMEDDYEKSNQVLL